MKVLLIAPYQGLAELAKKIRLEQGLDLDVEVGNLEEGVKIAKKAVNNGYDVIISRGGTAQMIQREVLIPVAHINISGYDMLRVLKLVSGLNERIALVGYSNITEGAAALCDILDINVKVITIKGRQEVQEKLINLKEHGYTIILGDVVTIQMAQKVGLRGVLITSGREALIDSLAESRRLYDNFRKIKSHFNHLEEFYNELPIPIVIYSVHQGVLQSNIDDNFLKQFNNSTLLKDTIKQTVESGETKIVEDRLDEYIYLLKIIPLNEDKVGIMVLHSFEKDKYPFLEVHHKIHVKPIVGESNHIKDVKTSIKRFAATNDALNIIGEDGTGKKLIAKNVHSMKWNGNKMMYVIDVSMLEDSLSEFTHFLENEGKALSGTILIKNIHLISRKTDQHLITFFKVIKQSCKVITISNKGLFEYVRQNTISDTLATILSDESLHLFALRDRKEDIRSLVHHYVTLLYTMDGLETIGIKEEALRIFYQYNWPSNVQELKQILKELSYTSRSHYISKEEVQTFFTHYDKFKKNQEVPTDYVPLKGTLREIEEKIIRKVMEQENQNQTKVAERLGINRTTLWRKINQ